MLNRLSQPICSIVIPAYNEATVIRSTLKAITKDARKGEFDIIVACNGCTDGTALMAKQAVRECRVLESVQPSKTEALNLGIAAAMTSKIVFLDADIITSATAIRNLIHRLDWSDARLAVGKAVFETEGCSFTVKAFYKAWMQNPYFDNHKMGGFFAVNKEGLKELGVLPNKTNDDEYIRRKLGTNTTFAQTAVYGIKAPKTLNALVKVRSRVYRGNAELEDDELAFGLAKRSKNAREFLIRLVGKPSLWFGATVFALVALVAHMHGKFFGSSTRWEKDLTNRLGSQHVGQEGS